MKLPTKPQEPNISPTAYKWLIMSGSGGGKSSFLASIKDILISDPDNGCLALPGYVIQVRNWTDCKELLKELQKADLSIYSWIGLDLLNVSYEFCYNHECKRMGVAYPSDLEGGKGRGKGWAMITKEFIGWVRDMGNIGLPIIATCHVNFIAQEVKKREFNKAVPSFPGGSATSAYQKIKEAFDIVGYLTFDLPPATSDEKDMRKIIAPNAELIDLPPHQVVPTTETRVIHFQPSQYWDAQDSSHQLPPKVVLPKDWREDWSTILDNWGKV